MVFWVLMVIRNENNWYLIKGADSVAAWNGYRCLSESDSDSHADMTEDLR
jgi:hypothetical protein